MSNSPRPAARIHLLDLLSCLLAACGILFLIFASVTFVTIPAFAQVVAPVCESQFRQIARTDIDCIVTYQVDDAARSNLKSQTGGAISDAKCEMPVKFQKRKIYGEWIKPNVVALPKLKVTCTLSGNVANAPTTTAVASFFQPRCEKSGGVWSCNVDMRETTGLGLIGRLLEAQVNKNSALKAQMEKLLD